MDNGSQDLVGAHAQYIWILKMGALNGISCSKGVENKETH